MGRRSFESEDLREKTFPLLEIAFVRHRFADRIVHELGGEITLIGPFAAGGDDDLIDGARDGWDGFARLREAFPDMLLGDFGDISPIERHVAGQAFVEDDAHRIDVVCDGGGAACEDFGRAIIDRALDRIAFIGGADRGGDAEIADLDRTIGEIKQIIRLDVAMDDAVLMDVIDATAKLSLSRRVCPLMYSLAI